MPGQEDPAIRSLQNRVSHLENRLEQYEQSIIALSHLVVSSASADESVEETLPDFEHVEGEMDSLTAILKEKSASPQASMETDVNSTSMDDSF